jgi:hypothetical protein
MLGKIFLLIVNFLLFLFHPQGDAGAMCLCCPAGSGVLFAVTLRDRWGNRCVEPSEPREVGVLVVRYWGVLVVCGTESIGIVLYRMVCDAEGLVGQPLCGTTGAAGGGCVGCPLLGCAGCVCHRVNCMVL